MKRLIVVFGVTVAVLIGIGVAGAQTPSPNDTPTATPTPTPTPSPELEAALYAMRLGFELDDAHCKEEDFESVFKKEYTVHRGPWTQIWELNAQNWAAHRRSFWSVEGEDDLSIGCFAIVYDDTPSAILAQWLDSFNILSKLTMPYSNVEVLDVGQDMKLAVENREIDVWSYTLGIKETPNLYIEDRPTIPRILREAKGATYRHENILIGVVQFWNARDMVNPMLVRTFRGQLFKSKGALLLMERIKARMEADPEEENDD